MSSLDRKQILQDVYALIAELWCNPLDSDINKGGIDNDTKEVVTRLADIDEESAELLTTFLGEQAILEEDYIDLFELDPKCPLYLGSHSYDEPKTCANSAVSDRNEYMIELAGVYGHFGQKTNGMELPDYLPLMVDFLSLTTDSESDSVRDKFINEYLLPFLPPLRSRLEELKTHYLHLLDALERVINIELSEKPISVEQTQPTQRGESYVG
jgi:nitrate reductase delta subunit